MAKKQVKSTPSSEHLLAKVLDYCDEYLNLDRWNELKTLENGAVGKFYQKYVDSENKRISELRKKILAKLTPEEREVLDLED